MIQRAVAETNNSRVYRIKGVVMNLFLAIKTFEFWIGAIVFVAIFGTIIYNYSDLGVTKGNIGQLAVYFEITVNVLTLFFGALFSGLSLHKIMYFSHVGKSSAGGLLGSIVSVLVTGCPACSLTLATYIGLGSVFAGLPFLGYEVRVLGLVILIASVVWVARDIHVCRIKK